MSDFDRLDRLRGFFHTGETSVATPDCLDEHTVAALADGTLDAEMRSGALTHVATCALCRRAIASVAVVFATEASDTVALFPDSIALVPGASYLWKVDARTGFDRWAASELAEFRVAGPRRR